MSWRRSSSCFSAIGGRDKNTKLAELDYIVPINVYENVSDVNKEQACKLSFHA